MKNDDGYAPFIASLRGDIRAAQARAAREVNRELLFLYWRVGTRIAAAQQAEGWGAGLIPRLARDLRNDLTDVKGFSERNLGYMVRFAKEYGAAPMEAEGNPILQPAVAKLDEGDDREIILQASLAKLENKTHLVETLIKLPWAHNLTLLDRVKDLEERRWYAETALAGNWTQARLIENIKTNAFHRAGSSVDNFSQALPAADAEHVRSTLKDPYLFDFLTLDADFRERELEAGLIEHLQEFLIELGVGFAFVGRQHRLELDGKDYFVDLLFYHLRLRRYVVVELKRGAFQPEFAGQLNFYLNLVDDTMRHADDKESIGLILCQDRNRIVAEYSLRGMDKAIGVSEYQLTQSLPDSLASSLPRIADIEAELEDFEGSRR